MKNTTIQIDYARKMISYGNNCHDIGPHLCDFVNSDFDKFERLASTIYASGDIMIPDKKRYYVIKDFFKELFYICFSDSFLKEKGISEDYLKEAKRIYTPLRRFQYFKQKNNSIQNYLNANFGINYDFIINYSQHRKFKSRSAIFQAYNCIENINDTELINALNFDPIYVETITINNFQSILYLEFMKILELGIPVKTCKNCGLYFVPSGRSDSLYCDNFYQNTGNTCKEIGISIVYKEKINKSGIHKVYNKHYKKMHARRKYRKIGESEFLIWVDKATIERENAIKSDISVDQFESILRTLEGE